MKKIKFLSTPDEEESLDFLVNILKLDIIKIGSGEVNNFPFLKKIAQTHKNIILSTGMSSLEEVAFAVKVLEDGCKDKITLMQCNTEYPTPFVDANLKVICTLKEHFLQCSIGYSDHTLGVETSVAAVALGAEVIEKHFTLDKNLEGPDHKASLSPDELKHMIVSIRNIEQALGDGKKTPSKSELKNKDIVRKSIVAQKNIAKGEIFTEENLTVKRPGSGVSPINWYSVLGQTARRDFKEDELIEI